MFNSSRNSDSWLWLENARHQDSPLSSRPILATRSSRWKQIQAHPMENPMQQYKTLTLQLLRSNRKIYHRLKQTRKVLPTLDLYSKELKQSHEDWKVSLSESRPGSDPSQIASESLELALQELEDRLQSELLPDGRESLTLDTAMGFLRDHSQPE
jgi:hypothetical protein